MTSISPASRRKILNGIGASSVAISGFGVTGSATAQHSHRQATESDGPSVQTSIDIVGTTQYIDECTTEPSFGQQSTLPSPPAEYLLDFHGEIFSNGRLDTRKSPVIEPPPPPTGGEINYSTAAGLYIPSQNLVTLPLVVDYRSPELGVEFTIKPSPTAGTSGAMTGEAQNLLSESPTLTLVANEWEWDSESDGLCDYAPPGENWFKLELDLSVEDPDALDDIGPVPLDPAFDPPQDLDGDGLHENVQGDGEFDIADVQTLHDNLDSPAVQGYSAFYDFSGTNPNEVTIFDVQALFSRL